MDEIRKIMKDNRICVIVPTYNNASTIVDVLTRINHQAENIIVVVDGSTDTTNQQLKSLPFVVDVVSYKDNKGKGTALVKGFKRAIKQGFEYALTIDADGQHFPEDIPVLINAFTDNRDALIVGCRNLREDNMPARSTFANKFSNFWFRIQTGISLGDTQSGYRLYPLSRLPHIGLITSRYESELELLVFSAWKGLKIVPVSVRVYYPPVEERVSHFRPYADFGRISLLNTLLCFSAVVYGYPLLLFRKMRRRR